MSEDQTRRKQTEKGLTYPVVIPLEDREMSRFMRTGLIGLVLLALAPIGCWDEKDRPRGEAGRDVIKVEEARLALLRLVAADTNKRFRGSEGDLLEDLDDDDPIQIGGFLCCRKDGSFFITVGDRGGRKRDVEELSGRFVRDDKCRWQAVLDKEARPVCHTLKEKEKPKRTDKGK